MLDLFSGIGGFSYGLESTGGFETVAFCEIEKYPQKILAKHWPGVPIYEDVQELTADRLRADGIIPDIITGGFPCQDISIAGKQKGIGEGTRSGLWSECARLVREIRPRYAIFENVTALLSGADGKWFERVLWDISQIGGYVVEWHCIPASQLGAHHHRDRVWIILRNTDSERLQEFNSTTLSKEPNQFSRGHDTGKANAPDPNGSDSRDKWKIEVSENGEMDKWEAIFNDNGKQRTVAYPNNKRPTQCLITGVSGEKGSQPNDQPIEGRGEICRGKEANRILANTDSGRSEQDSSLCKLRTSRSKQQPKNTGFTDQTEKGKKWETFSNSNGAGLERWLQDEIAYQEGWEIEINGCSSQCCFRRERHRDGIWSTEPTVCGVADGLSNRLYEGRVTTGAKDRAKRLKALGNSIVPQIAELIGRAILASENESGECLCQQQ